MALRERKMKVEEDVTVTPPPTAARRGRGRGAASAAPSASNTPRGKNAAQNRVPPLPPLPVGLGAEFQQLSTLPASSSMPTFGTTAADSPQSKPSGQDDSADDLLARALAGVDLDQSPSKPTAKSAVHAQSSFTPVFAHTNPMVDPRQPSVNVPPAESRPWHTTHVPFGSAPAPAPSASEQPSAPEAPPRIILRFPKLPRPEAETTARSETPSTGGTQSSGSGSQGAPFSGGGFGSQ